MQEWVSSFVAFKVPTDLLERADYKPAQIDTTKVHQNCCLFDPPMLTARPADAAAEHVLIFLPLARQHWRVRVAPSMKSRL